MELNQVTLSCADYVESVRFYKKLGLRLIVDSPPHYARFETATGITLSVHSTGSSPLPSEVVIYFEVDDVDLEVRKLQERGIVFETQPTEQKWLWREAYLLDPAGNRLCIFHAGENRRFPPWRVE